MVYEREVGVVMLDHKHYVPILRWKRAERVALSRLYEPDREGLTPLIELIPRDFSGNSPTDDIVRRKADEVLEHWGHSRFFADLGHLGPSLRTASGEHPLALLGHEARSRELRMVPVTALRRSHVHQVSVAELVATDNLGVCIRVPLENLRQPRFPTDLRDLLTLLDLPPEQVDLLLDFRDIVMSG